MHYLIKTPNIENQDTFYAELIHAQRHLSEEQADIMMVKLVLILCNHVGDRDVLNQAISLARDNTLASPTSDFT
jgi:Protein of unknown function (DUF2783)